MQIENTPESLKEYLISEDELKFDHKVGKGSFGKKKQKSLAKKIKFEAMFGRRHGFILRSL